MPDSSRRGERRSRADAWSESEEDLFHTNAHAAHEKEIDSCEKKVADANSNAFEENFIGPRGEFTRWIAVTFAKKKEVGSAGGRRIPVAESTKEKSFADSDVNAHIFAPSQEEDVADARTVRNPDRESN